MSVFHSESVVVVIESINASKEEFTPWSMMIHTLLSQQWWWRGTTIVDVEISTSLILWQRYNKRGRWVSPHPKISIIMVIATTLFGGKLMIIIIHIYLTVICLWTGLEALPLELQRNFNLMRDLDKRAQGKSLLHQDISPSPGWYNFLVTRWLAMAFINLHCLLRHSIIDHQRLGYNKSLESSRKIA